MESIIKKVTDFGRVGTWKGECAIKIGEALKEANKSADALGGLVDRAGKSLPNPFAMPERLAGINYRTCTKYCGNGQLSTVFNFEDFSSGAANYLLPWLALTAQLPFETGENEVLANVMSFSYAVGSPMLITYSLATTILNQHWLRGKFRKLETPDRPLHQTSKNIRIFLQESQQLPLRLSQENGGLASLIVLEENDDWWEKLKSSILLTRRGVTFSLVAQIIVAVLSWLLVVISAFVTSLGNLSAALALSSGTLWVWLIPIIYGWIVVGTQREYGTITRALNRDMTNVVHGHPPSQGSPDQPRDSAARRDTVIEEASDGRPITTRQISPQPVGTIQNPGERQKAFKVADQRTLMQPLAGSSEEYSLSHLERHTGKSDTLNCLGFSVAGDEKQEGPAFNYARIFTWWNMADRLYQALETMDGNLERRLGLDLKPVPRNLKFRRRDLRGDSLAMSRYCGLAYNTGKSDRPAIEPERITEYPCWNQLDSEFYQRVIIAMLIAVYVQWGITSAAIIISYLTEVTGLGCRSGGYLLYGALASLAFFFLFISSIFSHAAMLRHEALQIDDIENIRGVRYRKLEQDLADEQSIASFPTRGSGERGNPTRRFALGHSVLRVCAVLTRLLGRMLAVVNTIWIIVSTLWELVGFYNNCWCDSTYLSKGVGGWILLFVDESQTAPAATTPWALGVFLSVFVGVTSCGIFWLYCRGNRA